MTVSVPAWLERHGGRTAGVGIVVLAAAGAAALFAPRAVLFGYLSAFVLWSGVPLGCVALLMLHHLGGGRWGASVRSLTETAAVTVPLVAVLFVPVALGMSYLYPWAVGGGEHDTVAEAKRIYLNTPFFAARALVFLVVWVGGALLMVRPSVRGGGEGGEACSPGVAAGGLIAYVLTVSFAAIDWIGSLDPTWYSSIFGLYIVVGQALSALAVLVVAASLDHDGEQAAANRGALRDLGTLLLTLVVLHAYMAYAQFFIIWYGNLPHEIDWYVVRTRGLWGWVALLLIIVHFALPFAWLLPREARQRTKSLLAVAGVILVARGVEAMWLVLPAYTGSALGAAAVSAVMMAGMGALWVGVFVLGWRRRGQREAAGGTAMS